MPPLLLYSFLRPQKVLFVFCVIDIYFLKYPVFYFQPPIPPNTYYYHMVTSFPHFIVILDSRFYFYPMRLVSEENGRRDYDDKGYYRPYCALMRHSKCKNWQRWSLFRS